MATLLAGLMLAGLAVGGRARGACGPIEGPFLRDPWPAATPQDPDVDVAEVRKTLLGDPNAEKKFAAAQRLLRDHADGEFLVATMLSSGDVAVSSAIIRAYAVEDDAGLVRQALLLVGRAESDELVARLHDYYDIIYRVSGRDLDATLLEVVQDPGTGDKACLGAIRVLGWLRCLSAVPVLINMIDADAPAAVAKGSVLDALRSITLRDFGLEARRWRAWWEANGSLTREEILERHIEELEKASEEERARLVGQHTDEMEALRSRLEASEKEARELAGRLLEIEPQIVVRLLDHRDEQVRARALEVARDLASRPERPQDLLAEIHETLVRTLSDPQGQRTPHELATMIDLLGKIGPASEAARTVLIRYLEAGLDETTQAAAAASLRSGDDPQGAVAAALQRRLAGVAGRPQLPLTLLEALLKSVAARWTGGDPALMTQFLEMSPDRVPGGLRAEVCRQLGVIGDERAIPALEAVLVPEGAGGADPGGDLEVGVAAAQALTDIGLAARKVQTPEQWRSLGQQLLGVLGKGLDDPRPEVARQCIKHIAELRPEGAMELLVQRYEKDREIAVVREELIRQIAGLGGKGALPFLARALVGEMAAAAGGNGGSNGSATTTHPELVEAVRSVIAGVCAASGDKPSQVLAWNSLTVALLELQAPASIAWALGQFLEIFPVAGDEIPDGLDGRLATRAQIRFELALALDRSGQHAEAHGHLTGLTGEAGFPQVDQTAYYLALGSTSEALRLWPQAAAAWEKVAGLVDEADQRRIDAQLHAAHAYLEAATPEAAARANGILVAIEESCAQNPAYLFDAARAAHETGNGERALTLFGKYLATEAADGSAERIEAVVRSCQLRLDRGEKEAARGMLDRLGTVGELPGPLAARLADVRTRLGDGGGDGEGKAEGSAKAVERQAGGQAP